MKDGCTDSGDWFENIDWTRSKAYAFGLGGIYINKKGREAHGIVEPGEEAEELKRSLINGLSGLYDKEAGETAINEAFDNAEIHPHGPYRDNGPDLIIGYNRGYRASWDGAVGRITDSVFKDNTKSWSGDHCIDPRLVPGVLFSNRAIMAKDPAISDLAPTILSLFGVEVPKHMTGTVLPLADASQEHKANVDGVAA